MNKVCICTARAEKISDNVLIDLNYLRDLSEGNEDFIVEMLAIFLRNIPTELLALETAITKEDFAEIKALSHKMQSSANIVGVAFLASLLSQMEQKSKAQEKLADIVMLFKTIQPLFQQVIIEVEAERLNLIKTT